MKTFTYCIKDEVGIHARPAGVLVKAATKYKSDIIYKLGEKTGNGKKLFELMKMTIKQNDEITVEISGEDEEQAAIEIKNLLEENL